MKLLKKVENELKSLYLVESPQEGVLHISTDEDSIPFCMLLTQEDEYPNKLLVSFASDFKCNLMVADIMMRICSATNNNIAIMESFYITDNSEILFGEEAEWAAEVANESTPEDDVLMHLEGPSKAVH